MIRRIAWREFIEFIRDGRLPLVGGLFAVLLVVLLAVGWLQESNLNSERSAAQGMDYNDWLNQKNRHPHDAAHQGMHVFKPIPRLFLIDPGIDPFVGSTIWLRSHRQSEVKFRPAQDLTGLQRFGTLSAAWMLQILGPLFVIVLGFGALSGEREQGTLRQTLSLGVAPQQILWGKALALAGSLALLLLPALLLALTGAGSAIEQDRLDLLIRLILLGVGYALYLGIAIFVTLAVSAVAPSSRISLVLLIGLWIASVIVAPRIAADLSKAWHPNPTGVEFNTRLDNDLEHRYRKVWKEKLGTEKRWGPELPLNRWGEALKVDDHAGYEVTDEHFARLWDAFALQQQSQEWIGLAVPVLAIRGFSMGMAGTDFFHHREFAQAAERQRRLIQDTMSKDLIEHADPLGNQHFSYKAGSSLWASVPPFEYSPPKVGFALRHNKTSLFVLLAGLLTWIGIAHLAMPRSA
ncbi:MAG: ABC transporter permease subunit [Thermodesulfobacteriota bacterium]